jgi:hypothetical protein
MTLIHLRPHHHSKIALPLQVVLAMRGAAAPRAPMRGVAAPRVPMWGTTLPRTSHGDNHCHGYAAVHLEVVVAAIGEGGCCRRRVRLLQRAACNTLTNPWPGCYRWQLSRISRLSPQTNTSFFCALCPHSYASPHNSVGYLDGPHRPTMHTLSLLVRT